MHVLVVDDDLSVRSLLADEGFVMESASNGQERLTTLQGSPQHPCVILLDLMMPVMNGWEFRQAQRRSQILSAIPVVVISAIPALGA
jgi:CheY-like chemotaxis protein